MTILITGATGTIGSRVLTNLSNQGLELRALTRDPDKAKLPGGVKAVKGDMLDVDTMRNALSGISTLFLVNAVTPQELTEAILTLNLAREAGIKQVVYFSVFNGEPFSNVPHFAAKYTVEKMIEQFNIPATILRPNCFMQNDAVYFKDALLQHGVYPFPIGEKGVSMVDVRDIAEIAAKVLIDRERATEPLPHEIVNLVGPGALTGAGNAAIWSSLLEKPIQYTGDDTGAFERQMAELAPSWSAMDLRLMLDRFVQDGMRASSNDEADMTVRLGRPPRSYSDFAAETTAQWLG